MENKNIKILAIDDNKDNIITLKALVNEITPGSIFLSANDGTRGLELANTENPDVILLDIIMPVMDGYEVCQKLKSDEKLKNIPVVFITAAKSDKENRLLALESGGDAFLSKPIDNVEFEAQIRAMVKIKEASIRKLREKEQLSKMVEDKTRELQNTHIATLNLLEDLRNENEARKKSEQALRESEKKYRTLFELSPFGIILHHEEKILFANNAAAKMFGAKNPEALIGYELMKLVEPEFHKIVKRRLNTLQRAGSEVPLIEERLVRLDGSVFDAEVIAKEIKFDKKSVIQVLFNDISERKLSEMALNKMYERFNLAATVGGIGVWERDIESGSLEWDQRMYDLYEVERDDFKGTFESWLSYIHPDDRLKVEDDIKYAISNYFDFHLQFRILSSLTKKVKHIRSFGKIISDKKGKPEKLIGINYDISDRIKAEDELKKSKEKLSEFAAYLQTVRDEERSTISRELHDELGQLLSALSISVSSLIRNLKNKNEVFSRMKLLKEYMSLQDMINQTIARVRIMIDELRLEATGDFHIVELIRENLKEMKKNTGISYNFNAGRNIELNKNQSLAIYRIVQESLTNIMKHSNADNVIIKFQILNGEINLMISDNGIGITPDSFKKKNSWGLVGIQERVTLNNGIFEIIGKPGLGTDVKIRLPIID